MSQEGACRMEQQPVQRVDEMPPRPCCGPDGQRVCELCECLLSQEASDFALEPWLDLRFELR